MRRFLVPVVGDGVAQQREACLAAVAADHELPWPPKHVTPKRGRPNSDAVWVRAVQRRLLADGDLPSGVTGKRPGWWQHGMDVDKKPLEPEEVQAVTPCAEQVDVATTACAAEGSSGEVVPTAVCVKTKVHICPILKDWFLDFAGDNRERKQWSMAHSLRVARRLCPLFENIHDDAPRKWKYSSAPSSSRLGRLPLLKPFRGGIVAALHEEQDVPTSHARDLVRHGLRRSSFRAVDTAFFARPWLVIQAAQSQQAGLAFACGAGRPQGQPDAEDLLVPGNVQHSAVSHRQHR